MSTPEQLSERIASLEKDISALKKINSALIGRVERSTDSAGSSFSLFESNIVLQQRIKERTLDLQQSNENLQFEITKHKLTESELRKLQKQTRLIIDTALDAVIAFDRNWSILDWNPRAESTFGFSAEFAIDKLSLTSLIVPGGHDLLSHFLEERTRRDGRDVTTLELTGKHRDGREFPMELAVSILSGGDTPVYSAFIRDITERKLAEEARYRTLFDNSPVSLREEDFSNVKRYIDKLREQGITDLKKYFNEFPEVLAHCASLVRIIDVNLATTRLFRAKSKKHFCDSYNSCLRSMTSGLLVAEMTALAEGRHAFEREATLGTFDGLTIHVVVNLSIAPGHHNNWSKVFISVQDITDRKRAEEEKAKLELQLRQTQKMETIGTLAGGIAHDFNNMLTPILGFAEIIADESQNQGEIHDASENIITAAKRARDLVRQILTFSRQVECELKPVKLTALIKEVLDLVRATLPTSVTLHTRIDESSSAVMADPTQIHQVILNLCTNAYQSLENASGLVQIELQNVIVDADLVARAPGLHEGMHVRLTVRDTGCGIEEHMLHRVFEPFYTTKEVGKGTGMGLAVTHGIVQGLGGEILLESDVGQGSSFHVYLPAITMQPSSEITPNNPVAGEGRILVVDDEEMVAEVAKRQLERLGYTVTTMTNPVLALELFQKSPDVFDAVVTDQTMPAMPGNVLAEELRRVRNDIPILLLSGYSHVITDGDSKALAISELLQKPVSSADLSAALERAFVNTPNR